MGSYTEMGCHPIKYVIGKVKCKLKAKMLIDSGIEMCVMTLDLYERTKGLLTSETEFR